MDEENEFLININPNTNNLVYKIVNNLFISCRINKKYD